MQDADNIIKFNPQTIGVSPNFEGAGYFPDTNELKPISAFNFEADVLDVMTAAAEAGVLRKDTWVEQIFANEEVFIQFADGLSQYDEHSRIHDRWYWALFNIVDAVNEKGFVTSSEIVERMLAQAEATGQIEL